MNLPLPLYLPVELVGGNSTVNLSDGSRSNHPSHLLARKGHGQLDGWEDLPTESERDSGHIARLRKIEVVARPATCSEFGARDVDDVTEFNYSLRGLSVSSVCYHHYTMHAAPLFV